MREHSIKIEKTAYYYSIGELNNETNEIWIACHGYGQLAKYFIRKFECIKKQNRFIIAPEGFNKFYINGYSGRVGANWMTKEKRIDEIENELSELKNFILPSGNKIFSLTQIARTVCRRAERKLVKLYKDERNIDLNYVSFTNRLSDYLFVLSRKFLKDFNVQERYWQKDS